MPLLVTVSVHGLLAPSALPDVVVSTAQAAAWGLSLVAGTLVVALFAWPRGRQWTAVGVVAGFVMLTALSGRVPTLPFLDVGNGNWQGKILDLLWVGALVAVLYRWARKEAGVRWRLEPGSQRIALSLIIGVFVVFAGLSVVAVATGEDVGQRADLEQLAWDATIPNLTEELIWRGVMLAVLDRAFALHCAPELGVDVGSLLTE